jgi:DNA-binding CsgD family transcriptional regulator
MPNMARSEQLTVLAALGFSASLDRTYQRLRPQSGRDLARVAASMLRSPEELLDELAPLVEAGIVRLEGETVVVESPSEALRIMVAIQSVYAERAHRRLGGISDAIGLLAAEASRPVPGDVEASAPLEGEVATGGDIYALVRSLVLKGRGDLLWLRPDQWRGPREARMTAMVAEAIAGGDRESRAIYPLRAVHDAPEALVARLAVGEQIRVLPDLPSRLLVIGDSHAVLPEPFGYADAPLSIVRQRGVVEAMTQWFELLWERAVVPPLDAVAPRLDLRSFLLQQLAAGAHDEQIARVLGISLRTVRRRVADLMSELGVDSRFQAGVEAARRGWL